MEQIQVEDWNTITYLELLVNLSDHSLSALGEKFPNLIHLKLNSSVIPTIRDLGTSLKNLQVIWLNRCGIKDLDGIHALPELKEIYLAYNDIDDISALGALEYIQIIDLEGNRIDDIGQLMFLQDLESLESLSLSNNECVLEAGENYFDQVIEYLPKLKYLDDEPIEILRDNSKNLRPQTPSKLEKEEIEMLKNTIKYTRLDEDESLLYSPKIVVATDRFITSKEKERMLLSRPSSAAGFLEKRTTTPFSATSFENRPQSARPKNKPSRPLTAFGLRQSSQPVSTNFSKSVKGKSNTVDDSSSELTYGSNQVFAGNIVKNLRNRKVQKLSQPDVPAFTTSNIDIYDFNGDVLEEVMAYKLEEAKKQQLLDEDHKNLDTQFITNDFEQFETSEIPLVEDEEYFPSVPSSEKKSSVQNHIENTHNEVNQISEREARRRIRAQQDHQFKKLQITHMDSTSTSSTSSTSSTTSRKKPEESHKFTTISSITSSSLSENISHRTIADSSKQPTAPEESHKIRRPRPRYLQKSGSPSENIPPNHREPLNHHRDIKKDELNREISKEIQKTLNLEKEQQLLVQKRLSESRNQLRSIFAEKEKMRDQLQKSNSRLIGNV